MYKSQFNKIDPYAWFYGPDRVTYVVNSNSDQWFDFFFYKAQMSFICHIHNYTEYNEEWNVFSAFNRSKWSSGQPKLRCPGSSWGFGALPKGLTSVVDTSCQSRDSNPQPWVTLGFKSNALSIRPRLPSSLRLTHPKRIHTWSSGQPSYGARGAVRGSVPCSRALQSWYWIKFLPARDPNPRTLGYKPDSLYPSLYCTLYSCCNHVS